MEEGWINLLKAIYTDNNISIKVGQHRTPKLQTKIGLRQGCPLSPILFALYIADLEDRLRWTRCGFSVTTSDHEGVTEFKIPGLLYADDLVLVAPTYEEMEIMLNVASEFGNERGLLFNPEKSAIVIYSREHTGTQNKAIPLKTCYKYLGIIIGEGPNYLQEQEREWKRTAHAVQQKLHAQCLWSFNRFEISKIQWKATAVPKLTYANAVLVSRATKQITAILDKTQLEAGRWALGITGYKVANEFIQGELGWSSFEARGAQSKLRYFTRVIAMPYKRWPRAILSMMANQHIYTEAFKRVQYLRKRYRCGDIALIYSLANKPDLKSFYAQIKVRIQETVDQEWKTGMYLKSSLGTYLKYKT